MSTLVTDQQDRFTKKGGISLYRELVVGEGGIGHLLLYELITGVGVLLPGMLGVGFRSFLYPCLFASCGARPYLGAHVTIRNPRAITLGDKVLIDEGVTIDCRQGASISLGEKSAVGKGTIIAAKGGEITLSPGANIGSFCRIATQSGISIGESSLIAAYCYIGPGNHQWDAEHRTFISGDMELKGGVQIGSNCWIGTRATILDGVTIGDRSVVGAHSLVREDVPPGAIVAGSPAKVIGQVEK